MTLGKELQELDGSEAPAQRGAGVTFPDDSCPSPSRAEVAGGLPFLLRALPGPHQQWAAGP